MRPELIAGRYRVLRAVGRGGMGAVWLCRDEVLHREVAVKQIEGAEEESTAKAARPLREARLAAALNHENAVSMFDIVEDHGSIWLVMEYVPSRTLAEVLQVEGRLPFARVARIGAQLASALAAAHALGIIHRDIKPGNVLVGEGDLAKISDFGIARGHHDRQITLTGFVTGTPSYFSPELARGGDPSQASDVWALGATLYAAVEGEPPYGKDSNPLALLNRIASDPPPRPIHAGPLTSTLASMLNPEAAARASMESVITSLHHLADPTDLGASRLREKVRVYDDTTLHDQPMGFLDEMLAPAQPTAEDARPTVVTPAPAVDDSPTALSPPGSTLTGRGRPSLTILVAAAVGLLMVLAAGTLVWSLAGSPSDGGTSASSGPGGAHSPKTSTETTSSSSTTTSRSSTSTGASSATRPPSTPTGSGTSTPRTSQPLPPPEPGQDSAAFVTSYFHLVPDDLKRGFKELAPSMRKIGRDSYQSFWGSIESVDVADVHAVSADAVDYLITYHFLDGRVVREEKRIDLAPHGQDYWITDDTVLSSTTLHP